MVGLTMRRIGPRPPPALSPFVPLRRRCWCEESRLGLTRPKLAAVSILLDDHQALKIEIGYVIRDGLMGAERIR